MSCLPCAYPCASCIYPNMCLTCSEPYSFNPYNGVCFTCSISNCRECLYNDTSRCLQCSEMYSLSANSSCVYNGGCSMQCLQCILDQYCEVCLPGYSVDSSNRTQCVQCVSRDCVTCSSVNVSVCLLCAHGYYLETG